MSLVSESGIFENTTQFISSSGKIIPRMSTAFRNRLDFQEEYSRVKSILKQRQSAIDTTRC